MSEEIRDILPEEPLTPELPDKENPDNPSETEPSEGEGDSDGGEEPESPTDIPYTIKEYLQDISPLLTEGVLRVILAKRKLAADTPLDELEERDADLAEAEVYYHLSNLPVGGATTKDVDGSWSHTEGGWTVSGANIAEWYRKYAALREKWGEEVITKSKIRIINF